MKCFYITVLLLLLTVDGNSQKISVRKVPAEVTDSYKFAYPNHKPKKWELVNQQYYAHTKTSSGYEIAKFFSNGEWIETVISISEDELPLASINFQKERYAAYVLSSVSYVERSNAKAIYIVEYALKSNKAFVAEVLFDLTGKVIMIDGLEIIESGDDNTQELKAETTVVESKKTAPEILEVKPLVKVAFEKKFPRADNIIWENKGEYQLVYFNFRGKAMEASYLHDGILVYSGTWLDKETIPELIKMYLSENMPKAKFIKGKKVVFEAKYFRLYPEKKQQNYYQIVVGEKVPKQKELKVATLFFDASAHFDMKMDYEADK